MSDTDFSITKFRSNINDYGVSFANKYIVKITMPNKLNANSRLKWVNDYTKDSLSIRCDSVDLPGKSLASKEVKFYGPFRKIPYAMTYEDLNINIILSSNLKEKTIFSEWMNLISDYQKATCGWYQDYTTDLIIETYNNNNECISKIKFIESYPISIGQISYSYSNADISKLPVSFSYLKWEEDNKFL
jgi:hypothetical protein